MQKKAILCKNIQKYVKLCTNFQKKKEKLFKKI